MREKPDSLKRVIHENIAVFLCISTFLIGSCDSVGESKNLANPPEPKPSSIEASSSNQDIRERKLVSYKGVEFYYDASIADDVEASDVPEYLTPNATASKDSFEARHLRFQFERGQGRAGTEAGFSGEMEVYAISDYRSSAKKAPVDPNMVDGMVRELDDASSDHGASLEKYPYFQGGDATQIVHAHRSIVSFKNGKGVGYVTQVNPADPDLVNNSDLIYVFEGLTEDKRFFVSATFQIRAPFLPEDSSATTYKNYERPDDYYSPLHRENNIRQYKEYLKAVQDELRQLSREQFDPPLGTIQNLLASLSVQPTFDKK